MNKIDVIGMEHSRMKLIQDMQRMVSLSRDQMMPFPAMSVNAVIEPVSFSQVLNRAIDNVDQLQHSASDKQNGYELGLHDDLTGTMLESQKASVAFSAMIQTRNKLTSALDEIMNIPL